MMILKMLGWTDKEVSEELLELWPDAKGLSEDSIQKSYRKNCDDNFFGGILDNITRGCSVETVAKRHALPPILVQAIKLRDMTDQERFKELGFSA
ncbi:MAG: hypothetical protein HY912_20410 [Desulfomonile tiedjei]|uniref:Uncharacterized protein n=1 Tax=Desulfomonile tiedjei TaxID=2358 RepID=A0A9D6V8G2_9BACT|nr:hypothetical protein [Desulfomonile tiedjei]